MAYCCFKDAVILELVNNTTSGSTTATDLVDDDTAASVAELPIESRHTIVDAMTLSAPRQLLVHTISNTMFLEAKECLLGCAVEPNITTSKMQLRINTLAKIIPSKLQAFKSHGIPASRDLQYHWVFSVFTDNIHSLCQLAGAFNQISNSIESAGVLELECLLKPPSVGHYAKVVISDDEGYATLQGASLWHDDQRARFRISSCVHGSGKTFESLFKDTLAKSKSPSCQFSRKYPFHKPSLPEQGGWDGVFDNLSMYVGVGFDPNGNNECFTRSEDGVFVWSDVALKKLGEANIAGATDIKSKQMTMVCCMFEFLYYLMLDAGAIPGYVPFNPFIGRSINLQQR